MAQKQNNQQENPLFQKVVAHAKEYGFVFQSSEVYDGLQAVYDYGQIGVQLKNNIKQLWWKAMTQVNENIVGIDAAIFMHPLVWKASGHVDNFSDPMIDNKDSKKRYRVDHLIEEKAEVLKSEGKIQDAENLLAQMDSLLAKEDFAGLYQLIIDQKIACNISNTINWTEVRQFNLMFSTQMGAVAGESDTIYLRPETAQGIFVNFLNVQKTGRMKIPFGIAQIGKAFRNEIVAKQFIFRMREFEQMEMQYFVRPGEEMQNYNHWKQKRMSFLHAIGLPAEKLRFHDHVKLAHYANAAVDIEYEFPFGFKELEGIHSRTDFDLTQHQALSKTKMIYFDEEIQEKEKQRYVPYVVETSIGADRLFLAILCNSYTETTGVDAKGEEKTRLYLKLHPAIAPVKVAVFPLVKKDGLPEKAREVFEELRYDFDTIYEEKGAIGKNYTRMDMIGTPFCVTIDHDTLNDEAVTVRFRDTTEQVRIAIKDLKALIAKEVSLKNIFDKLK
ncbi:MAG: glycine--tRNA ligase [Bacteroidetes bacterium]|nr:MAG: glycine--tRNA ligase [Bacteroidota bacterium]TAG89702.1 MAG: glycine--tRNA ligase [Bacteroidota bacterium]